ncbi:MAG: hypothetical protein ACLFP4_02890 [Spirochaetales bacterium]
MTRCACLLHLTLSKNPLEFLTRSKIVDPHPTLLQKRLQVGIKPASRLSEPARIATVQKRTEVGKPGSTEIALVVTRRVKRRQRGAGLSLREVKAQLVEVGKKFRLRAERGAFPTISAFASGVIRLA